MNLEGSSDKTWNTDTMRDFRDKWTLAEDVQLLKYLERFSQSIITKANCTLKSMDNFENAINCTCIEVNTVSNMFQALADTQFVENRVYDEDSQSSPTNGFEKVTEKSSPKILDSKNQIKDMLLKCLHTLDTKFETVELSGSESEAEDDSSSFSKLILKPVNRYRDRPLPHLIGSEQFMNDDTLGLVPFSTDESENEEDDSDATSPSSVSFKEDNAKIEQEPTYIEDTLARQLSAKLCLVQKPPSHIPSDMSQVHSEKIEEINYEPGSEVKPMSENSRVDVSTPTTLNSSASTLAEITHIEANNVEIEHDLFKESRPNSPSIQKIFKPDENIFGDNIDIFNENSRLKSDVMKRDCYVDEAVMKSDTSEDDIFCEKKKKDVRKEENHSKNLFSNENEWDLSSPDNLFQDNDSPLFGPKHLVLNKEVSSDSKAKDIFSILKESSHKNDSVNTDNNTNSPRQSENSNNVKHFPAFKNKPNEASKTSNLFGLDGDLFDDNSNLFLESKLPKVSKDESLFFEDDNEFDDLFTTNNLIHNKNSKLNTGSAPKSIASDTSSVKNMDIFTNEKVYKPSEYFSDDSKNVANPPFSENNSLKENVANQSMEKDGDIFSTVTNEVKHQTGASYFIVSQANISKKLISSDKSEGPNLDLNGAVTNSRQNKNQIKKKSVDLEVKKGNTTTFSGLDNALPPILTSTLHCVAKERAKIQTKRRLPTRKRRNTAKPQSPEAKLKSAVVLSPSTDEEDLFIIPSLDLPKERSSNDLFSGSVLLSPGVSIDNESISDQQTQGNRFNVKSSYNSPFHGNSGFEAASIVTNVLLETHGDVSRRKNEKDNSKNIFDDYNGDDIFSSQSSALRPGSILNGLQNKNVFDDFEDDLFKISPKVKKRAPLTNPDSESGHEKVVPKTEIPKILSQANFSESKSQSLFDDISEDDDIFSGISQNVIKSTAKPANVIIDDNIRKQLIDSPVDKPTTKTTHLTKKEVFHDPLMSSSDFSHEQ